MTKKQLKNKQNLVNPKQEGEKLPVSLTIVSSVVATLTGEGNGKTKKRKLKPSEKPHYVNSKQFEEEIKLFYKTDNMTEYLADAIKRITYGLSFAPNFINYSYRDEMMGDALVKMYQALKYKKIQGGAYINYSRVVGS